MGSRPFIPSPWIKSERGSLTPSEQKPVYGPVPSGFAPLAQLSLQEPLH